MSKYINPFTDWGFKRLFGQEFSKELLISFLNDLFEGELHIKDLTFKDKELLPSSKDIRGSIFDIYCETDEGKHFIVEMQNRWVPLFINRSICYASEAIAVQRERERTKDNPTLYQLVPVYTICLMNYLPKEETAINKFKTDVMLREKKSEIAFTDKLRFIYISLPFFKKKKKECVTDFDKWIYILKHMEVLERIPFTAQKKIFEKLAQIADCRNLDSEEKAKYNASRDAIDDYYSSLVGAWIEGKSDGEAVGKAIGLKKGLAEGMKQGMEQGMAQGMAQGMKQGIAQGEMSKSISIAKKMLASGMSQSQVIEMTGLSQEQVQKLLS